MILFQWPCFVVDFYSGTPVIRLSAYDEYDICVQK